MKTAEEWLRDILVGCDVSSPSKLIAYIGLIQSDAQQAALIKQLGEALWIANANMDKISYDVEKALEAYNNYLRERGE